MIARYARTELMVLDLCRYRDYAEILVAVGLSGLRWLGFSPVRPAGLSA